jgi:hypothetical protein
MRMAISPNVYERGDDVRCTGSFANDAGVATDPTAVTFRIVPQLGTATTYTYGTDNQVVKESTGIYHVDYTPTVHGPHTYEFVGTGAVQRAVSRTFLVKNTPF